METFLCDSFLCWKILYIPHPLFYHRTIKICADGKHLWLVLNGVHSLHCRSGAKCNDDNIKIIRKARKRSRKTNASITLTLVVESAPAGSQSVEYFSRSFENIWKVRSRLFVLTIKKYIRNALLGSMFKSLKFCIVEISKKV